MLARLVAAGIYLLLWRCAIWRLELLLATNDNVSGNHQGYSNNPASQRRFLTKMHQAAQTDDQVQPDLHLLLRLRHQPREAPVRILHTHTASATAYKEANQSVST